jgi:UDP-N-acetylglucosamine 1-carboxyvinyltransferase
MDKIIVNGGKKLQGSVKVSGAKNAALPILFATMLTDGDCIIENVPRLVDINTALSLLDYFGKKTVRKGASVEISARGAEVRPEAPYELVKRMRASFLVASSLLARFGRARISLPGGCAIGVRPVDIHLKGFEKLGAGISIKKGYVELSAGKLKGADIALRYPSVGATENLMIAAALADGTTVIGNAAREPEIVDLAGFLNSMNARISGAGTNEIKITGVKSLLGCPRHRVIPDRIETGTYLIAGAITRGEVEVTSCEPRHVGALIAALKEAGLGLTVGRRSIGIKYCGKIKPANITTKPYPGFPTDLQAQWMALMSISEGKSVIRETVFENRFMHVGELQRLGADLEIKSDKVIVRGGKLTGAPIMVSDLRAGASLVLAALAAAGTTTIERVYHIDRGYERIEEKLSALGADIKRV